MSTKAGAPEVGGAEVDLPRLQNVSRRSYLARDQVTLLLGEPDVGLTAQVVRQFDDGFVRVQSCASSSALLFMAGRLKPSLLILRAVFPDCTAAEVIETLRQYDDAPIVVSVGPGETHHAGPALLAGASEFVDHPYRAVELRETVGRHLRRIEAAMLEAAKVQVGALTLDGPAYAVWAGDRRLPLTTREFEVLRLMMNRVGRVVSFEDIRDLVWVPRGEDVNRKTLATHIHRLREHLAPAAEIVTVRGIGYRLSA